MRAYCRANRNSTQCCDESKWEGNPKKKDTRIHIDQLPCQQKATQHCKATTPNKKSLKKPWDVPHILVLTLLNPNF